MSDEDRDVDIESDAEKRAHHNALERKRRDHIKESFHSLRDSVPSLQGEKVSAVSRAQILKKAADYIQFMRRKNHTHQQDIDDLRKQNTVLEQQIRALEKAKSTGQFAAQSSGALNPKGTVMSAFDGGSGSESSETEGLSPSRRKKMKMSS
ncbi:protein max-like isoform X2 [Liolophura sinensis]|uniref:protein max-like isoform X2 n=1 Tax=Liolophura sinensis TaxID=3198878 RepID=UPI0031597A36